MIRDVLEQSLRDALAAVGVDAPGSVHLERPARREHGDWSSNIALATAKSAGRNPRELAAQLVGHLAANPPAHVDRINTRTVKILAIEQDSPFDAAAGGDFMHSVKAPDKSRLAAARWSDQGGYFVGSDQKVDIFNRAELSVINIQLLHFQA